MKINSQVSRGKKTGDLFRMLVVESFSTSTKNTTTVTGGNQIIKSLMRALVDSEEREVGSVEVEYGNHRRQVDIHTYEKEVEVEFEGETYYAFTEYSVRESTDWGDYNTPPYSRCLGVTVNTFRFETETGESLNYDSKKIEVELKSILSDYYSC